MSRAISLLNLSGVVIGTHDKSDMVALATFMLALSRTDLDQLGVNGNANVEYRGGDYVLEFWNGVKVARPTLNGSRLFRRTKCPNCGVTTWSLTNKAQLCWEDKKEFLELDEAKSSV